MEPSLRSMPLIPFRYQVEDEEEEVSCKNMDFHNLFTYLIIGTSKKPFSLINSNKCLEKTLS